MERPKHCGPPSSGDCGDDPAAARGHELGTAIHVGEQAALYWFPTQKVATGLWRAARPGDKVAKLATPHCLAAVKPPGEAGPPRSPACYPQVLRSRGGSDTWQKQNRHYAFLNLHAVKNRLKLIQQLTFWNLKINKAHVPPLRPLRPTDWSEQISVILVASVLFGRLQRPETTSIKRDLGQCFRTDAYSQPRHKTAFGLLWCAGFPNNTSKYIPPTTGANVE